ncbi:winged helix-turn-helix domain-containing protein [Allomeiothermus silvanus]|uniref:winged helix-turn-helix domain-containing protein n=1 Tax=Allomeiothermus silvanus TaxID=52022 RepID=UPI0023F172BF|nr:LysR family transcriptional regulator [Allomeiothermus silvanus]
MRPKAKIWLEREDGSYLMGPGAMHLLRAVAEAGSLKGGAKRIGMSYRKAWAQLKEAEATLGFPLLQRHSGGEGGGGSALTPAALDFLGRYERFRAGVEQDLEARFREAFADW